MPGLKLKCGYRPYGEREALAAVAREAIAKVHVPRVGQADLGATPVPRIAKCVKYAKRISIVVRISHTVIVVAVAKTVVPVHSHQVSFRR